VAVFVTLMLMIIRQLGVSFRGAEKRAEMENDNGDESLEGVMADASRSLCFRLSRLEKRPCTCRSMVKLSPQCVRTSAMSLAPLISVTSEVRERYEKFNPKKKLMPFYT